MPLSATAASPSRRLLSRDQEQPSEESEFRHRPGATSSFTSQVPGPKGPSGDEDGGLKTWVHQPHPSDQNAASRAGISTVRKVPAAATVSLLPSIELRRFQAQFRERRARQMPGAISSPTSHIPLLKVALPGAGGVTLGPIGGEDTPATAAPAEDGGTGAPDSLVVV